MQASPLRCGNTAVRKQTQSLPSQSLYFLETDKERHITCPKAAENQSVMWISDGRCYFCQPDREGHSTGAEAKIKMKWRTSTQVVFWRRTCQVEEQPSAKALKQRAAWQSSGTGRQREQLKSREQREEWQMRHRENQEPHHEKLPLQRHRQGVGHKQDGRSWSGHGGLKNIHSWERGLMAWTSGTAERRGTI